jgi:alkylation response protein AidB-like acyl-CoA dehydrogenase
MTKASARAEVRVRPKLAVDDPAVLHSATVAGLGIGLLPEFLCRQGVATAKLRKVLADWQAPSAAPLYAVFPAGLENDPRVKSFVEFAAANIVPHSLIEVIIDVSRTGQGHPVCMDELIGTEPCRPARIRRLLQRDGRRRARRGRALRGTVLEPSARAAIARGAVDGVGVTMPAGYKAAYEQFCDSGWPALRPQRVRRPECAQRAGHRGVELWASANLAFKLCPMLTQGAIEAIEHFATPALRQLYLPKMVSGQWTGTMNLTEPQAGSDSAQVRTRAVPAGPNYRLYGQKIFITYGEHDLTENVVHMVLARIDGAPPGVRGISLFIVPKFWVNADGKPAAQRRVLRLDRAQARHPRQSHLRDDVRRERRRARVAGGRAESRPRIHVRHDECRAAVGGPRGLRAGRTRLPAGGRVGAHARAGQAAGVDQEGARVALHGHQLLAGADHRPPGRQAHAAHDEVHGGSLPAMALYAAHQLDLGNAHPDDAVRSAAQARGDLLIPVVKGFCTEAASRSPRSASRCTAAWATSRRPAPRRRCATCASPRSTRHHRHPVERPHRPQDRSRRRRGVARLHRGNAAVTACHAGREPGDGTRRDAALERVERLGGRGHVAAAKLASAPDQAMAVSVPFSSCAASPSAAG